MNQGSKSGQKNARVIVLYYVIIAALMPGQSQCLLHANPKLYTVLYSLFHLPVPVSKYVLFYRAMNWGKTFFLLIFYFFLLVIIIFLLTIYFLSIFHIFSQFYFIFITFSLLWSFFSLPVFIHFKTLQFFFFLSLCLLFFLFVSIKDSCDYIIIFFGVFPFILVKCLCLSIN